MTFELLSVWNTADPSGWMIPLMRSSDGKRSFALPQPCPRNKHVSSVCRSWRWTTRLGRCQSGAIQGKPATVLKSRWSHTSSPLTARNWFFVLWHVITLGVDARPCNDFGCVTAREKLSEYYYYYYYPVTARRVSRHSSYSIILCWIGRI